MARIAVILAATLLAPNSLVAPFATTPPELMTVSGTIELTATATTDAAGHIFQVVLFINGTPVATNQPPAPGNLQVQ